MSRKLKRHLANLRSTPPRGAVVALAVCGRHVARRRLLRLTGSASAGRWRVYLQAGHGCLDCASGAAGAVDGLRDEVVTRVKTEAPRRMDVNGGEHRSQEVGPQWAP